MPEAIVLRKNRRTVWEAVSTSQAAVFLGVSDRTLRRYRDRGLLHPFYLPSGHARYDVNELRRIRSETTRPEPVTPGQPRTPGT